MQEDLDASRQIGYRGNLSGVGTGPLLPIEFGLSISDDLQHRAQICRKFDWPTLKSE